MPVCAVIDNQTNQQVNLIVAEPTDPHPDGCRIVEIPDGHYWDGQQISRIPEVTTDGN